MKKTKVFGFTLIAIVILVSGVFIGYFIGLFSFATKSKHNTYEISSVTPIHLKGFDGNLSP